MIQYITSKTNPRIKDLLTLKDSKVRKERGVFLVEGFHLLEMALEASQVELIVSLKVIDNIPSNIDQLIVTSDVLKKLSSQVTPQGVVVVCKMKENFKPFGDRILYLDQVSDPGNLGTILRTAASFGFNDVILAKGSCSPYNEKVLASSQGSIFSLQIKEDDGNLIRELKDDGYQILVTYLHGAKPVDEIKISHKVVLVMGNEAHGVSEDIVKLATTKTYIPLKVMESLNVGVATGIMCYHIDRYLR